MRQRKIIVLGMLLFALPFLFAACEKEGVRSGQKLQEQASDEERSQEKIDPPGGGGGELCVCPGYTLTQDDDGYDCPPGSGCSKITPCPCPGGGIANDGHDRGTVLALEEAVESDEVPGFFREGPWKELFPFLEEKERLLDRLREGELTVVRLEEGTKGSVHYACVEDGVEGSPDPEASFFALQVPGELLAKE